MTCHSLVGLCLALSIVSAQTFASSGKSSGSGKKVWRTPDGDPDLQGIWSLRTLTPLERPDSLAGKEFLTDKDIKEFSKKNADADADKISDVCDKDPKAKIVSHTGVSDTCENYVGSYNEAWWDMGTEFSRTRRTSIIVDPPNGKLPPKTPEEEKLMKELWAESKQAPGPESQALETRCLTFRTGVPPMLPYAYNNDFQLLQTKKLVTIYSELGHQTRFIFIDGRPHLPPTARLWLGDSIGHWEGDTLVVDTTNFKNQSTFSARYFIPFVGIDQGLHVTEKFKRVAADTILYRFTVFHPGAFTKSWSGEETFAADPGPIYEYACHEGNEAMTTILKSARAQQKGSAPDSKH